MTDWKMITIPKELHKKLIELKKEWECQSIWAVIQQMIERNGY